MKVVHLAAYGRSPYSGSFIPMLRAIGRTARRRGADLELVLDPPARGKPWISELEDDDLPIRFLQPRSRRSVGELRGLRSPAGASTVMHSHFSGFDLAAAAAGVHSPATAVFWHVHTILVPGRRAWVRNAIKYRLGGSLTDGILCAGIEVERELVRRLAPRNRMHLAPNAIDTSRFQPATRHERSQARTRLGLPLDAEILLHFGWNWPIKDGDLYLRAVQELLRAKQGGRSIVALTVGGGEPARRSRAALALEDSVRIVNPVSDVRSLYAVADVFVSTSRAEGSPFALAEALSCGLPVVATDIPAHRALAAKGLGAYILAPGQPTAIAAAIHDKLTLNPDQRAREAASGREYMVVAHDVNPWSERLFDLYEHVLAERSNNHGQPLP